MGPTGVLQDLLAVKGWELEDGTSENTTKHYGIFFREDTVVATWTANDRAETDLVAKYGLGAKTMKVTDAALLVGGDETSSSITLTSGSVGLLRA